jgi:hypothetical protein
MKVGDRGVDFAHLPATYEKMKSDGVKYVCRYSAGVDGSSNDKTARPGEIDHAVKVGMDFIANFEKSTSTPIEGGPSGKRHGLADKDFWNARGLAPGAGVIISWEPGSDKNQYTNVAAFLTAYRGAIDRPVGLYAGLPAMVEMRRRGIIDFTWLPMSSIASGYYWPNITGAEYSRRMEALAKDNGINLCQNRQRMYGTGADVDVFTTMNHTPFTHLQALEGDNMLTAQDIWDEPITNTLVENGLDEPARTRLLKAQSYANQAQAAANKALATATATQELVSQIISGAATIDYDRINQGIEHALENVHVQVGP